MTTVAIFVAAATFTVTSSKALTSFQVQEVKKAVLGVPVPEMPAKAAELVTKAERKDRQAVAVTAVRAVAMKHRAATPTVVSAISKVAPELAPAVAVAASEIVTEQAPAIAHAATVAAPGQARQISSALPQVSPSQTIASSTPSATATAQNTTGVNSRGSANNGGASGGTIIISPNPIDTSSGGAGNGTFNGLGTPQKASDPVVVYGAPQP